MMVKRYVDGQLVEFTLNGKPIQPESIATTRLGKPIYKSNCIDPETGKLKPESECAKKKAKSMEENKNKIPMLVGKTGTPTHDQLIAAQKRLKEKLSEKPQPKEQHDDTTRTG